DLTPLSKLSWRNAWVPERSRYLPARARPSSARQAGAIIAAIRSILVIFIGCGAGDAREGVRRDGQALRERARFSSGAQVPPCGDLSGPPGGPRDGLTARTRARVCWRLTA